MNSITIHYLASGRTPDSTAHYSLFNAKSTNTATAEYLFAIDNKPVEGWQADELEEIQDYARYRTESATPHGAMSVGDVVEIKRQNCSPAFLVCSPIGWVEISRDQLDAWKRDFRQSSDGRNMTFFGDRAREAVMFSNKLAEKGLKVGGSATYTPVTGEPYEVIIVRRYNDNDAVVQQRSAKTTVEVARLS